MEFEEWKQQNPEYQGTKIWEIAEKFKAAGIAATVKIHWTHAEIFTKDPKGDEVLLQQGYMKKKPHEFDTSFGWFYITDIPQAWIGPI